VLDRFGTVLSHRDTRVHENASDNAARDPVSARDAFFRDSIAAGAFVEIEQVAN